MLIEIVHANGQYDHTTETHLQPVDREPYYDRIVPVLSEAAAAGHPIIYRPNYATSLAAVLQDPEIMATALATDPFLRRFGRDNVLLHPDGLGATPAKYSVREDRLARAQKTAVVLGGYIGVCVDYVASNLARRNPDVNVTVDYAMSISHPGTIETRNGHNICLGLAPPYHNPVALEALLRDTPPPQRITPAVGTQNPWSAMPTADLFPRFRTSANHNYGFAKTANHDRK